MSEPSVTVIIPSTGAPTLSKCVNSVLKQTYENVKPYIVFDGYPFVPVGGSETGVSMLLKLEAEWDEHIDYTVLAQNVGKDGWYGHRIYASFPFLIDTDYICFLDQDNWLEPNHVECLIEQVGDDKADWAYSLRKIVDVDGSFICHDDCESIGKYGNHIDTSCFLVATKDITRGIVAAWYGKWGADRQFYNTMKLYHPNYACSGEYSLNYRLGGNDGSVKKEFFIEGNKYMHDLYNNKNFPWSTKK